MKLKLTMQTLSIFFVFAAICIAIEQYWSWGSFFEFDDIHHELFIFGFMFTGLTLWTTQSFKVKRK